MFDLAIGGGMYATRRLLPSAAREHSPAYCSERVATAATAAAFGPSPDDNGGPTDRGSIDALGAALATIRRGIEELRAVERETVTDDELGNGITDLVALQTTLAAQESRLLRDFDARGACRNDACLTTAAWLRFRTPLGYHEAKRRVKRVWVLNKMPQMSAAFESGDITAGHVDAVSARATQFRLDEIAEHDETLAQLARDAEPRDVALAVKNIVELMDRDGTEDPPPCSDDDLREVHLRSGLGSLGSLSGSTTALLTELLMRTRDVFGTVDPPDTPEGKRRTEGQKFHDALQAALAAALDGHQGAGIGGVKTHAVVFVDLFTLLGQDDLATITPRLSRFGNIDPELARHLIATTSPTLRMILALGPWMPISVGRARRVLPPWLRAASELTHQHCRAPGCDRPFAWTEADHLERYADGGVTALFNDGPLCGAHHDLKEQDGWVVTFDVETGVVTWTSRDATRCIEVPPPEP